MKPTIERRYYEQLADLEVRDGEDGTPATIVGYPIVFNQQTLIDGLFSRFMEQVSAKAFTKTLKEGDIRALFNHDPNMVLGRNTSKTLKLRPDDYGVYMEVQPPPAQWATDLITSIKRGDVSGGSFAVRVIRDSWTDPQPNEDGSVPPRLRTIEEGVLYDVSVVTYPAYPQTDIQARCAHCGASPTAEPSEPGHSVAIDLPDHDAWQVATRRQRLHLLSLSR